MSDLSSDKILNSLEYFENPNSKKADPKSLKIIAFNAERGKGLFELMQKNPEHEIFSADIILLNEVDNGMARSFNKHITKELAEKCGFHYLYAVEFIELTKGNHKERKSKGENTLGLHGNAILSKFPLKNNKLIRLPETFNWNKHFEKRMGSRMALISDVEVAKKVFTLVCVHLENQSSPESRAEVLEILLKEVKTRDKGQTIIIAGDMNTLKIHGSHLFFGALKYILKFNFLKKVQDLEPMFNLLKRYGYEYDFVNKKGDTLNHKILRRLAVKGQLDWFFVKNLEKEDVIDCGILNNLPFVDKLSDHYPIFIEVK
jgi:endonuclease/exonuclease/phosphatase family metal-dependent hydrolase